MLNSIIDIVDAGLWWWPVGFAISLLLMIVFFILGLGDEEGGGEKRVLLFLAKCLGPLVTFMGILFVWSAVLNSIWNIFI